MNIMIESDARQLASHERPRRYSATRSIDPDDIERITVPPSTELIPDEYTHEDNSKGLIFIFHSSRDEENVRLLREALTDQKYIIPEENVFRISTKQFVEDTIIKIAEGDHTDNTCLIVAFLGNVFKEDRILPDDEEFPTTGNTISIRDVWAPFTSDSCPSLKYKPKVFIFQTCRKPEATESDAKMMTRFSLPDDNKVYDIPAEADILIVYKKIEDATFRDMFIEQLCNNFHYEGHKDDIIGLVTHTLDQKNERRSLIVSTLTRKFYIRPSEKGHRGYPYDLHVNHEVAVNLLQDLHDKVAAIQEQQLKFKKIFDQRRRLHVEPTASTIATHSYVTTDSAPSRSRSIKSESSSKRVSRTSSVDSKSKPRKAVAVKQKPRWR